MFKRKPTLSDAHEISRQRLPPLSINHCNVLQALVGHLLEFKSHKEKLFTKEGKASERKMLLRAFDDGVAPTTKVLKKVSSTSICHVIRQMLETEHAPLIPYVACEELLKVNDDKLLLNLFQGIVQSMPSFHAVLLSLLLELMNKISMKSQSADASIMQHLGIYLIRPSESAEELKGLLDRRISIARCLVSSHKLIAFGNKSNQATDNGNNRTTMEALPRRSSCIPWTKKTMTKITPLLHHLIYTPGDKRDLFQSLQAPAQVNKFLNDVHEGNAIQLNEYSLQEIAAALKQVLQPLEALISTNAFQLSNQGDGNVGAFITAVHNLAPDEKNLVRLLFKLFHEIISQGAAIEFLSSAMSHALFDQLKHILTVDANEQSLLKQAACLMLTQAKQIIYEISPRPSCFTVVTVVWLVQKLCRRNKHSSTDLALTQTATIDPIDLSLEPKLMAKDPIPSFHTGCETTTTYLIFAIAPQFNELICSKLPILQKLFFAFCRTSILMSLAQVKLLGKQTSSKRMHDVELVQLLERMEIIPGLTTSAIAAELSHTIQSNRRNINDNRSDSPLRTGLSFEGFVELILTLGVKVLSQPEFDGLYPNDYNKMLVVMEIWGFGNDKIVASVLSAY